MLFIRRVLLSAAVFIAFLAMFDYPYSKMAAGSNDSPIEAWIYVMGGDIDADLVVLGNSRASSNYETRVLDSLLGIRSHDIAIKGCGIYEQSYMYDLFRRLNRKPRALLINVDHVSLVRNDKISYREQFFPWFYSKDFREVVFPRERFSLAE